jgi:intron-binding protein aquarius
MHYILVKATFELAAATRSVRKIVLQDTFLDAQHIIDSFPQYDVTFVVPADSSSSSSSSSSGSKHVSSRSSSFDVSALLAPPYKVTYPSEQQQLVPAPGSTKRGPDGEVTVGPSAAAAAEGAGEQQAVLLVESYRPINMGPYPEDKPKDNAVRFTPVQVEAIGAGVQPGAFVGLTVKFETLGS